MKFRVLTAAVLALLASITAAAAQGCGTTNPNCVVPTRPSGDSTKAAASTEFVATAISPLFTAPTPTRAGDIIYWNGSIWTNLPGNNSGTQFLQETSAGVPSWATIAASAGTLVSIQTFAGSQTITIPATATKAFIRMTGGSGGSPGGTASTSRTGGGGGGGYLEKYLTGLTAGNTVVWTQGTAGAAGPAGGGAGATAGGISTLASGTQTISTLTCNGGAVGTATSGALATGGTASGGDVNVQGMGGVGGVSSSAAGAGGINAFTKGGDGASGAGGGNAGTAGTIVIMWFT